MRRRSHQTTEPTETTPPLARGSSEQMRLVDPDGCVDPPASEVIELTEDERKTAKMRGDEFRRLLRSGAAMPGPSTIRVEPFDERPTGALPPIRARRRRGNAPPSSATESSLRETRALIRRGAMKPLERIDSTLPVELVAPPAVESPGPEELAQTREPRDTAPQSPRGRK